MSSIDKTSDFDWEEEYAYTLGVQAFIYAFPWAYMPVAYKLRLDLNKGTVNQFTHLRKLKDESHQLGGAPNNDTLYSQASVYLGKEPLILSLPALPSDPELPDYRYHNVQLTDYRGDQFAYVGTRATGGKGGNFAIVGPNWSGDLPEDVQELEGPSPTPWAFLSARNLLTAAERTEAETKEDPDLDAVHAIQDQYVLTPLSVWKDPDATPEPVELWEPYDRATDPLADWKNINRAMVDNPPDSYDASLLELFETIGVGPGLDIEVQSESTKRGLERAAVEGLKIVDEAVVQGYAHKEVNGWKYPPSYLGRPSSARDWLVRAMQAQAGFLANDTIEAIYMSVFVDKDGNPLSGKNRYELRFDGENLPDVNAFWSVSMYDLKYNLVANPINRNSLGDRSGMKQNDDGGYTIYIQYEEPSDENLIPNWLPAPEGDFFMFMRLYLPGYPALSQYWEPPSLENLGPAEPSGGAS
ncbi:hypothetical protein BJP34_20835 [Moorena producens PAL-8-15-08-1]|uniref:Cell envelope protein n=1 Tax=Moorena producens PAL-8-15-08-1 TaxID=1458985 RepID=A0A1D8TV87_9CYAN|nr:DUF1254 domain-containing protein [Moorena producens]AOX01561.1 hypothetical protein BJP34_20835 [Moorena producens PAL-8-15-08-1]